MAQQLVIAQVIVYANTPRDAEEIVLRMDKHHPTAVVTAAKWEETLEEEEDEEEYDE